MNKDILHNLETAKPNFMFFIKNMNKELYQWIQYSGIETEGSKLFFKFKSSQNSLRFKVYAGVNINNVYFALKGSSNYIYDYFRDLKNSI